MSLTHRVMTRLAAACADAGLRVLLLAAVLFGLGLFLTLTRLRFDPNRHDLSVEDSPTHIRYIQFNQEFPLQENALVIVAGPNPARNHAAVDRIAADLRRDRRHYAAIYDRVDTSFARNRLLLFLTSAQLASVRSTERLARPVLQDVVQHPDLVWIFTRLNDTLQQAVARAESGQQATGAHSWHQVAREAASGLPHLSDLVDDLTSAVANGTPYHSAWQALVARRTAGFGFHGIPSYIYLDLEGGHLSLILVRPARTNQSAESSDYYVAVLRRYLAGIQRDYPEVTLGLTGKPVVDFDQLRTSAADSTRAVLLSLVGVVLLFVIAFARMSRPMLAMACLLVGLVWTLGFAAVDPGHLDTLTVIALPMLIGLGIDFAVQIMTRYEEERILGLEPRDAMAETLAGTGVSVMTASLTIAASFAATALTGLQALRELATVASAGILLCAAAMLVVFPVLLLRHEGRRIAGPRSDPGSSLTLRRWTLTGLTQAEGGLLAHAPGILALALVLSIGCGIWAGRVRFDANLIHLQANNVPSVQWESRLSETSGHGVFPAAMVADNLDQARRLQNAASQLPSVSNALSVVPLFPPGQAAKVPLARLIQQSIPWPMGPETPITPARVPNLRKAISGVAELGLILYPYSENAGGESLEEAVQTFVESTDRFAAAVASVPPALAAARLNAYQHAMYQDLAGILRMLQARQETQPMRLSALPPALRRSVVSARGRILVTVFPRGDVWDPSTLETFVTQLRTVDPNVTGFPVEIYESTRVVGSGYARAGLYAALAVLLLTILHFRSLLPALLAVAPVGLGLLWMLGIMAWLNIPFNMANKIVIPLLLGIGAANGIYVVRRCQEEGQPLVLSVSTGRAILLSNFMALIGFGSLLIARYQGMYSIGLVMVLGLGACIVTSLVVLPAFLEVMRRWAPRMFGRYVVRAAPA